MLILRAMRPFGPPPSPSPARGLDEGYVTAYGSVSVPSEHARAYEAVKAYAEPIPEARDVIEYLERGKTPIRVRDGSFSHAIPEHGTVEFTFGHGTAVDGGMLSEANMLLHEFGHMAYGLKYPMAQRFLARTSDRKFIFAEERRNILGIEHAVSRCKGEAVRERYGVIRPVKTDSPESAVPARGQASDIDLTVEKRAFEDAARSTMGKPERHGLKKFLTRELEDRGYFDTVYGGRSGATNDARLGKALGVGDRYKVAKHFRLNRDVRMRALLKGPDHPSTVAGFDKLHASTEKIRELLERKNPMPGRSV